MTELSQLTFRHPSTQQYAEYWLSLPRNGLVPSRVAFEPSDIPSLLPGISIHEILSPEMIRVRLAGTGVVKRFGYEVTGSNHLDHIHPSRRARASLALRNIALQPCGMLVLVRAVRRSGLIYEYEGLGLPFLDAVGRPSQIIYQTNIVTREQSGTLTLDPRVNSKPIRRQYIEIGNGVPDWDYSGDTDAIDMREGGWRRS